MGVFAWISIILFGQEKKGKSEVMPWYYECVWTSYTLVFDPVTPPPAHTATPPPSFHLPPPARSLFSSISSLSSCPFPSSSPSTSSSAEQETKYHLFIQRISLKTLICVLLCENGVCVCVQEVELSILPNHAAFHRQDTQLAPQTMQKSIDRTGWWLLEPYRHP